MSPITEQLLRLIQSIPSPKSEPFKHHLASTVARGEDTAQSDIDLLVDLEKGRTLLDLGGALVQLQDLLGRRVDIVTERGLHWYLREKILREARPL